MNLARVKRALSWRMHAFRRRFSPPIAFMHIPKTAGTSISEGLRSIIEPVHPLRERMDRSWFGNFDRFDTFSEAAYGDVFLGTKPMPKNTDFISGHFSLSTIRTFCPRAKIITFLREPSTRILSQWLYSRSIPTEAANSYGDFNKRVAKTNTLMEFLTRQSIYYHLDNVQMRMLLWPHALIPNEDIISEKHDTLLIEEALAKLDVFFHIDVVENSQLEENLSARIGKPIALLKLNVTSSSKEYGKVSIYDELTHDVWGRLDHFSRLDLKLWEAVVNRKMPGINVEELRNNVIEKTTKRYEMI